MAGRVGSVASLGHGPGMLARWAAAGALLVLAIAVPLAVFGFGGAAIDWLMTGQAALARHTDFSLQNAWSSTQTRTRALAFFLALLVIWCVVYLRRPSMWPRIAWWGGVLMGAQLALTGLFGLLFVFDPILYDRPLADLLYFLAAPLPPLLGWGIGRVAASAMARPLATDLTGSVVEVAIRAAGSDEWLLLQHDRIARAPASRRLGFVRGITAGMPLLEVEFAQLGRVADPTSVRPPDPLLRLVGTDRQWLVPVPEEHAESLLALVIGRVERARNDPAMLARATREHQQAKGLEQQAQRDVRTATNAMRHGFTPATRMFSGPGAFGVLVVAILTLTMAVLSFLPQLMGWIFGSGATAPVNPWGGIVFGLIGIFAARMFLRYARGRRFLQNRAGTDASTSLATLAPAAAPVAGWTSISDPVRPAGTALDPTA